MYRMRIERNHLILTRDLERLIKVSKQSLIYLYAAFKELEGVKGKRQRDFVGSLSLFYITLNYYYTMSGEFLISYNSSRAIH